MTFNADYVYYIDMLSMVKDNFFTRFFWELFPGRADSRYNAIQTRREGPGRAANSPGGVEHGAVIVYSPVDQITTISKADYGESASDTIRQPSDFMTDSSDNSNIILTSHNNSDSTIPGSAPS